jgi:transcriptional regulator with XRE-family HTH domain
MSSSVRALAHALKAARQQTGLTQEAASAALGVSRATLSAIESGKRRVLANELQQLATLYAIPMQMLLGASEEYVLDQEFAALPEAHKETIARLYRQSPQPAIVHALRLFGHERGELEVMACALLHFLAGRSEPETSIREERRDDGA